MVEHGLILIIYITLCNFRAKIYDSIKIYIHHGKNYPHHNIEDFYIFLNIFLKQSDYYTNNVYGTVLISKAVSIEPITKPKVLYY